MNVFDKAADIVRKGWVRHSLAHEGGVCLEGALSLAMIGWVEYIEIMEREQKYGTMSKCHVSVSKVRSCMTDVLREQYPEHTTIVDCLNEWNDTVCQSGDECVRVLEKASVKWEEMGEE